VSTKYCHKNFGSFENSKQSLLAFAADVVSPIDARALRGTAFGHCNGSGVENDMTATCLRLEGGILARLRV
jgi:hypothetical protein